MSRRPRLADLYSGGGGAAVGYHRAGFEVVGFDLAPQHEYPFEFHLGSALSVDLTGFDAVHASPPCQHKSPMARFAASRGGRQRLFDPHPNLIAPTRDLLVASGLPYIIENVPGAELRRDVCLCGTMFGLEVIRHRWFEVGGWNPGTETPPHSCKGAMAEGRAIGVFGHGGGDVDYQRGRRGRFPDMTVVNSYRRALAIDHLTNVSRLAEAIPPAYTEWLGRRLIEHLR